MSKVRFEISMSLDGMTAGPSPSVEHPLGVNGKRVHEWVFHRAVFHAMIGEPGGLDDATNQFVASIRARIGATIMGRNMFGGGPGPWPEDGAWTGWWGAEPPFRHEVFVLTHHARDPLNLGATTFHFVTDGYERALERAAKAAGGKDVHIGGGANTARQYLRAGLVDEMVLHVAPVLLGVGERLFEGMDDLYGLGLARTLAADDVTTLVFERR